MVQGLGLELPKLLARVRFPVAASSLHLILDSGAYGRRPISNGTQPHAKLYNSQMLKVRCLGKW